MHIKKLLRFLIASVFILLLQFLLENKAHAQENDGAVSSNSGNRFETGASLMTNYVWHGITQSRKNPALQSYLYYGMGPQFKAGFWGSSVSYDDNKSNLLLKFLGEIKIDFSQNFKMKIQFTDNHYFESGGRDGNSIIVNFGMFSYNVIFERESNWQKTGESAQYFGFQKTFAVFTDWFWNNQIGYTMFADQNLANYIDLRSFIGTQTSKLYWDFGVTWVNNATQFDGNADIFLIIAASVNF